MDSRKIMLPNSLVPVRLRREKANLALNKQQKKRGSMSVYTEYMSWVVWIQEKISTVKKPNI